MGHLVRLQPWTEPRLPDPKTATMRDLLRPLSATVLNTRHVVISSVGRGEDMKGHVPGRTTRVSKPNRGPRARREQKAAVRLDAAQKATVRNMAKQGAKGSDIARALGLDPKRGADYIAQAGCREEWDQARRERGIRVRSGNNLQPGQTKRGLLILDRIRPEGEPT